MRPAFRRPALLLALAAASALPLAAQAHRGWMLPSATVLSGEEPWVTVDAAVSNDVFYFEHQPMRLDNLLVFAPDGQQAKAENTSTGRYRSTFDVKLTQKGTYKIAMVNDMLMASFKLGSENKRLRGTAESLAREIPAGATDLSVTHSQSRNEIFVTSGKPSTQALQPTGRGLEMVPVTHPNDLFAGDTATFRFTLDGKPAADLAVAVIPGGIRYRDKLDELKLSTDANGEVKVTWPGPGMYWLNAAPARGPGPGAGQGPGAPMGAGGQAPRGPRGTLEQPVKRASYTTTLEVLPQ